MFNRVLPSFHRSISLLATASSRTTAPFTCNTGKYCCPLFHTSSSFEDRSQRRLLSTTAVLTAREPRRRAAPARGAKQTPEEDTTAAKYDSWQVANKDDDVSKQQQQQQQQLDDANQRHEAEKQEAHNDPMSNLSPAERAETQIDALKSVQVQRHVAKVYSTAGSGMAMATVASGVAITTGLAWAIPGAGLIFGLGSMVPMMMLHKSDPATSTAMYRNGLFATVAGMQGFAMAPILGTVLAVNPVAVPMALGGTALVFAGATAAALFTPRGSMLKYGVALGGAGMAFMAVAISNLFIQSAMLFQLTMFGGLSLFSVFLAYDTQSMIERFRAGDRDHLLGAMNIFLNIIQTFRMLLVVFGLMSDD